MHPAKSSALYKRLIRGKAFKFSKVDFSYMDFPFGFTLEAGKSISCWFLNKVDGDQTLFSNADGTQFITISSARIQFKTSTGAVYATATGIGVWNTPTFVAMAIKGDNVLQVVIHALNQTPAVFTFQLAAGEVIAFPMLLMGQEKALVGGYMDCLADDLAFWNRVLSTNDAEVIFNNAHGVKADQLPFSNTLIYYAPFDGLNLISRTTPEVQTGQIITLKSPKLGYFNPSALYCYDSLDYVVGNDATDWDIDAIEVPANDVSKNLVITFIFSSDVTLPVGQGIKNGYIMQLGDDTATTRFNISIGQASSGGEFIGYAISANDKGTFAAGVAPTAAVPFIEKHKYHVVTVRVSPTGVSWFQNAVNIMNNANLKIPMGDWLSTKIYLGRHIIDTTDQFFGYLRETSIVTKPMTDAEIVALQKNYLGLAPETVPDGLPSMTLETTAYDISYDIAPADIFVYWKGNRVNGAGADDPKGLILEDSSGNNRHLRLVDYVFPEFPVIERRGRTFL